MGSRALAGEGVAASATRLRGQGRRPVSAREGKEGEGGTDGARKTAAAAKRFTSAAAAAAALRPRLGPAGKEGLQASGSCAAEREAREDARMPRDCSPASGGAGWPAMARRRVSLAAVHAETRGRCRVHKRGKGARKDSCSCFIGQGRERERRPANWPSMAMAAGPALMALKEASVSGVRGRGRGWGNASECTAH
jgi:hypothetical protein